MEVICLVKKKFSLSQVMPFSFLFPFFFLTHAIFILQKWSEMPNNALELKNIYTISNFHPIKPLTVANLSHSSFYIN